MISSGGQFHFVQQIEQRIQGVGTVLDFEVAVGQQFARPLAARAGRLQFLVAPRHHHFGRAAPARLEIRQAVMHQHAARGR